MNQQNQDRSDKSSKTSRETINSSSNNINFDDIVNTNSSSSLTFNPNSSLFFPVDHNQTTQFPQQHTLFFTHHNPQQTTGSRLKTGGLANSFTTLNPAKKQTLKAKSKQSQRTNQDPLSHIYETISVTSASNCNLNGKGHMTASQAANHYNLLNYYHMHQNQQMNNYNDLECDYDPNGS